MNETNHTDTRSIESDSSSSYESYSSSRNRGNDSRPQFHQAGDHRLTSERLVASPPTSDWINTELQDYDEQFVKENEGFANSYPYLDDEVSGKRDDFYDELYLGTPQVNRMAPESSQKMLDHSSASSGYLRDEQSPTISGDPSTKPKFGSFLRPMSRAELQRCKKRSYQIAVVAILLVIILSVTLGITLGRGSQAGAESSQPPETTSPPSDTSKPIAPNSTTPSNSTIPASDGDFSGQSAQVETAEQVASDALASTSLAATQRPVLVRRVLRGLRPP
jgi:hypothetical protein